MTPKASFLANEVENAKRWLDISDSTLFQRACEVTILQLVEGMPDTVDTMRSAAAYSELLGARNALRTLRNLAVKPNLTRPAPDYELTGTAPKR